MFSGIFTGRQEPVYPLTGKEIISGSGNEPPVPGDNRTARTLPGMAIVVNHLPANETISGSGDEIPVPGDNRTVHPPLERAIVIDPLPDHFTDEPFIITGTTNLTPGDELLVEISSSGSTRSIKGIITSGSTGTVTIWKEPAG
jgi:hypothetical protein